MVDPNRSYSLITATMDFFGRQPEQTIAAFQAEYRQLTEKDLAELRQMLKGIGYNISN